jgi:hypothetical protein
MDNLIKSKEDKEILNICSAELSKIFDTANLKVCSDCPLAKIDKNKTIEDAEKSGHLESKEAGCCSRCAHASGYFTAFSVSKKRREHCIDILKKKYGWDDKYGFFNNVNKKCRIPRVWRSYACLSHSCCYLREELKDKDYYYFMPFIRIMDAIKRKHKIAN